jgi:hypothetical protein
MVSLFAHSTSTSEKMVELLAHAGLAIAPSSINNMVQAMSTEATRTLKSQLPGLVAAIAYDNLDISFRTEQPTVDHSSHLAHITTGTFMPLQCATKDDMRVSEEIWSKSKLNPNRNPAEPLIEPTHKNLMGLLLSSSGVPPDDPLSIRSRMAWHIRDILLHKDVKTLAPALKEKLQLLLGQPQAKRSIPVVKTKQYPAQAMCVSVSSNSGNAVAIEKLLEQGGASDSDLDTHVVLVHGDLGSGEKLENLKVSRCIEETPQNRLQHVQFVPGVLHIEMAITDSVWRLYLKDEDPSSEKPLDPNTMFHLCSLTCPRETRTLASGPQHHMRQHAIDNALLALVADAWRAEVQAKHNVAISEWPATWEEITEMSYRITDTYIADFKFVPLHEANPEAGDMVNDSAKLFGRDVLLWKMFKYSARHGDVGSLEDLLPIWVCIWKHTGKHKYAEHITQFLLNLQQVWPRRFSDVVRNNWLVNPTGKSDGFRAADWVVERNNLMHKVVHAGDGPNRTVENIVKESTLIEVYEQAHDIVETNFYLTKSTLWHSPPAMENTLAMLQKHIQGRNLHSHISGRKIASPPVNSVVGGLALGTGMFDQVEDEPLDEGNNEGGDEGITDEDSASAVTASDVDERADEDRYSGGGTDGEAV